MVATDPIDIARALSTGRGLCLLDGGRTGGWSRLFADPMAVFESQGSTHRLTWTVGTTETGTGDPFHALDALLARHPHLTAAGYWSYDLRYALERLPRLGADDLGLPDCRVGLYSGVQVFRCSGVVGAPPSPHLNTRTPEHLILDSTTREEYEDAVRKVLDYIAAGDCYQVNLSHRFSAPLRVPPWSLYERLRTVSPAPYAAYLDCGDHQVLSSSPELFLRVADRQVETRPIKGTRPRGATPKEDAAAAAELLSSEKDRAELLMIVDLERNDLGRVCEYGSVHVPELYHLESFANVHHLVATVRGRLRPEVTPLQALRAAFPGGSITGAPKIRAMEIIEELEPLHRGVYTGAIGWVDGHGNAEWNIAIRTMVAKDGRVHFHAGGGIVADSVPRAEYEETLAKAAGMLRALE